MGRRASCEIAGGGEEGPSTCAGFPPVSLAPTVPLWVAAPWEKWLWDGTKVPGSKDGTEWEGLETSKDYMAQ